MKSELQTFTYEYPWEAVVEAYLRRYPTHPRLPILLSTKVLLDTTDPVTRIRNIERLCTVNIEAPKYVFLKSFHC